MKKIEILSIHNLFYFLFILVLIFGFTTIVDLRPNSQTQTGNAISGEWTSYTSAFSGSGTESDPYKIASAENLAYLASQVNSGTTYSGSFFRQTANIDLSAHYWVPIGIDSTIGFAGTYDGDGHTISKMTFNKLYDHTMALFGKLGDGLITNLGVIDTAFPTNITAEVDNALETIGIANIVGSSNGNSGDIINCYSSADIDINVNVNINIDSTDISGTLISCNIAGINAGACSASNCYNTGDIKVSVTNSNPNFSLQLYIEGIGATSHNCYNTGSIDCEMNGKYGIVYIAGIGDLGDNCFNAGNIDINANNSTISTIYIGGVFHYSYSYGGIIGQDNTYTYSGLYNKGNIYYTGATGSTNVYMGGIGGSLGISKGIFIYPKKYLSNTFNLGNITTNKSSANVGGILGRTDNNGATLGISNCQNTGQVSGDIAGGIAGYVNGGSFSNCIYGGNCTLNYGIGSSSSNSGCTKQSNLAIDMSPQVQSWYTSNSNWNTSYPWDFEDTWMINSGLNDGYPVFQWQLNQLEYIINLNANGGTLNIGGQTTVPYGSSYTMPSTSSVTRTGYTLTGWKAVIENSTYTYTPGQIITIPTWSASQTTVTFYAQWQVNTYVVSFDAANYISYPVTSVAFNGSGGDFTYSNIDNEIVHSFKFRDNVNKYDASTGFYIDLSALTAEEEYEWSIYVKSTRRHAISIGQEQGGKIDAEVTTSWTRITHKFTATPAGAKAFVIYRGNGSWEVGEVFEFKNLSIQKASDTPADQATGNITVTYGQKYTNLPVPTRYGYVFDGWYTSEEEDADKITKDSVVTIASNHTLYSRWTPRTDLEITIDPAGGKYSGQTKLTNQQFRGLLSLSVPTKEGYIFDGWEITKGDGEVHLAQYYLDEKTFNGNNYQAIGREYMYTDLLTISLWAYMDDWSLFNTKTMRLLSCAEGGGWDFEPTVKKGYLNFEVYNKGVGYSEPFARSTKLLSEFKQGWHHIVVTFNGSYVDMYIDGEVQEQSTLITSGEIGYNANNAIFIGAEASENQTTPDSSKPFFNGKMKGLTFYHNYVTTVAAAECNIENDDAGIYTLIPYDDLTITAKWTPIGEEIAKEPTKENVTIEGTTKSAYLIQNAEDLIWLAQNPGEASYAIQTNHISLNGVKWSGIGNATTPFEGYYDGRGYTISGLTQIGGIVNKNGEKLAYDVGLFGVTLNATIKNIYLEGVKLTGLNRVGGIVGNASGTTTVSSCAIIGSLTAFNDNKGGVIGYSTAEDKCEVQDCLIDYDEQEINIAITNITVIDSIKYSRGTASGSTGFVGTNWVDVIGMKYTKLPKGLAWIASGG